MSFKESRSLEVDKIHPLIADKNQRKVLKNYYGDWNRETVFIDLMTSGKQYLCDELFVDSMWTNDVRDIMEEDTLTDDMESVTTRIYKELYREEFFCKVLPMIGKTGCVRRAIHLPVHPYFLQGIANNNAEITLYFTIHFPENIWVDNVKRTLYKERKVDFNTLQFSDNNKNKIDFVNESKSMLKNKQYDEGYMDFLLGKVICEDKGVCWNKWFSLVPRSNKNIVDDKDRNGDKKSKISNDEEPCKSSNDEKSCQSGSERSSERSSGSDDPEQDSEFSTFPEKRPCERGSPVTTRSRGRKKQKLNDKEGHDDRLDDKNSEGDDEKDSCKSSSVSESDSGSNDSEQDSKISKNRKKRHSERDSPVTTRSRSRKKQRVKEFKYELSKQFSKEIDDIFQQQEGGIVNLEFITHRNVLEVQWRNKDQLHGVIRPMTEREMADSGNNKSNLISPEPRVLFKQK